MVPRLRLSPAQPSLLSQPPVVLKNGSLSFSLTLNATALGCPPGSSQGPSLNSPSSP